MAFAPSGKTLVTAGGHLWTGHVAFWDLDKMTCSAVIADTGMGSALAISPDGKTLVVHSIRHLGGYATAGEIHVYDLPGGKKRFAGKDAFLASQALAISHDGKLLAFGNTDGSVSLCDLKTGNMLAKLVGGNESVWAVSFSPDNQLLAAAGREAGLVRMWKVLKGLAIPSLKFGSETITTLTFSPDGKTLIAGTGRDGNSSGELILWDVAGNREKGRWQGHTGPVIGVQFDRAGKLVASAARSADIILWDWATGKKLVEFDGPLNLSDLQYSPDGKTLAVAGGTGDFIISIGGVRLWDMPSGRERLDPKAAAERDRREKFFAQTAKEQAAARAAREEKPSSANAERLRRAEYALKIHQARSHIGRWEFLQARALLNEVRPGPGQADLRSLEWHWLNAATPRTLDLGSSEDVSNARISPDGKVLAVAHRGEVRLLDSFTGETLFTLGGFRHQPDSLVFSPDGTLLAAADYTPNADQSDVKVFQVATGKLQTTFTEHRDGVECLGFSGDGSLLVAAGRSTLITVWETKKWKLVRSFKQEWIVGTAVPSPDLKLVASGTMFRSLQVRELATGKELFKPGPEHRELGSNALLFLPDGKNLIAESDRKMFIVEAATGRIVRQIKSATGRRDGAERFSTNRQASLVLTPDGGKLISGWSLIDLAADEAIATFEQGEYAGWIPRREDRLHSVGVTADERVHMLIGRKKRAELVSFPLVQKPRVLSIGGTHLAHLGFSDDGTKLLASTYRKIEEKSDHGNVIVGGTHFVEQWDARTGAIRFRPRSDETDGVTLSFDKEKRPVIKAGKAKLTLSDLAASRAITKLVGSKGFATVQGYSARSGILALGDRHEKISFVDAKTGVPWPQFKQRPSGEQFSRFIADGQQAVSLAKGELVLWDVRTCETLKRWAVPGSVYDVRMTADGKEPATVVLREWKGERRHLLWDLRVGEALGVLRGHGQIEAAAFSPDGQTLATIGEDGTVLLWDAVTGHARGVLGTNLHGFQTQLVFRPDGRGLAVGGYDGTIRLWTVP